MNQNILRGEIYYANLDPVIGHEQGGTRPVLITQNNIGNKYSPTVITAAITSANKPHIPTHVSLRGIDGLPKDSLVMLEQLRVIDKSRLLDKVCELPISQMRKIDEAIRVSLDINVKSEDDSIEMCLCYRCSQQFYDSPDHFIYRSDPYQVEKEQCDYCAVRTGYDYIIKKKSMRGKA